MIDYIIIPDLRCRRCERVTATYTRQSCINKEPRARTYTIGSHFDLPDDVSGFAGAGYLPTRPEIVIGKSLRVLEVWCCACCGAESLCVWSFSGEVFTAARLVENSPSIFKDVEFVTEDLSLHWLRAELLKVYPGAAEVIASMWIEECIEVLVTGRMIEDG